MFVNSPLIASLGDYYYEFLVNCLGRVGICLDSYSMPDASIDLEVLLRQGGSGLLYPLH